MQLQLQVQLQLWWQLQLQVRNEPLYIIWFLFCFLERQFKPTKVHLNDQTNLLQQHTLHSSTHFWVDSSFMLCWLAPIFIKHSDTLLYCVPRKGIISQQRDIWIIKQRRCNSTHFTMRLTFALTVHVCLPSKWWIGWWSTNILWQWMDVDGVHILQHTPVHEVQ